MSTIHLHETTTSTPEQFVAGVTDFRAAPQELSIPPRITTSQAKGFTLWATRSVLSGRGDELLEVARTNLRELALT